MSTHVGSGSIHRLKNPSCKNFGVPDIYPKRNSPGVRCDAARLKVRGSDTAAGIAASVRRALASCDH
jgi:hypothetical protein